MFDALHRTAALPNVRCSASVLLERQKDACEATCPFGARAFFHDYHGATRLGMLLHHQIATIDS